MFALIASQVQLGQNTKNRERPTESVSPRASSNLKNSPNPSSLRPQKQNKGNMTRTSPQNEVNQPSSSTRIFDLPTYPPAAQLIGQDIYDQMSSTSLQLYRIASEHALERGVILADTKFEFGLLPAPSGDPDGHEQLILIDEVLTPDSSRYWPLASYSPGKSQPSFDKQYVRDWLVKSGFRKGLESGPEGQEGQGWKVDDDVVKGTRERYAEALELLTRP